MEQPLPFIKVIEESEGVESLHVNPDVLDHLRNLPEGQPLAVISIVGPYRSGKSYLLNRILSDTLDFSHAEPSEDTSAYPKFELGGTVEPCTQGIWAFLIPAQPATDKNPEVPAMLLLDTEGLGSYDRTRQHDVTLFTLSLLLSSVFVFNSRGRIDEDAIDQLNLVVELSRRISVEEHKANTAKEDDAETEARVHAMELRNELPTFIWALRDFSLDLTDSKGRALAEDEYLERSLSSTGFPPAAASGNNGSSSPTKHDATRVALREYFPRRHCVCLPLPVSDDELLQDLSSVARSQIRGSFLKRVDKFIGQQLLRTWLRTKTVFGRSFSGAALAAWARRLVEIFNAAESGGGIVPISSTLEFVVKSECARITHDCLVSYDKRMNDFIADKDGVAEREALHEVHQKAQEQALKHFVKALNGDSSTVPPVVLNATLELHKAIADRYATFIAANEKRSEEYCKTLWDKLSVRLESSMKKLAEDASDSRDPIEVLQSTWKLTLSAYNKLARGPASSRCAADGFEQNGLQATRLAVEQSVDRVSKRLTAESDAAKSLFEESLKAAEQNHENLQKEYDRLQSKATDMRSKSALEADKQREFTTKIQNLEQDCRQWRERVKTAELHVEECVRAIADVHVGELFTWGRNDSGRLGRFAPQGMLTIGAGDQQRALTPARVIFPSEVVSVLAVRCGDAHTVAHVTTRTAHGVEGDALYGFGRNSYGQLGLDTTTGVVSFPEPMLLPQCRDFRIVDFACGKDFTILLAEVNNQRVVLGCGANDCSQLASSVSAKYSATLVQILVPVLEPDEQIVQVAAGATHTLLLSDCGRVYGCGKNDRQQVSAGITDRIVKDPVLVEFGSSAELVKRVNCGRDFSVAVFGSGRTVCWGSVTTETFGPVAANGHVVQVACGSADAFCAFVDEKSKLHIGGEKRALLAIQYDKFQSKVNAAANFLVSDPFKHIGCGDRHGVVVNSAGLLYAFGDAAVTGADTSSSSQDGLVPLKDAALTRNWTIASVACGGGHSAVVCRRKSEALAELRAHL